MSPLGSKQLAKQPNKSFRRAIYLEVSTVVARDLEDGHTDMIYRRQPWSTYAVQLTTLSPPALIGDVCLWLFLYWGTVDWTIDDRRVAFSLLGGFMVFSKFIKLVTHFVRFPVDIFLWPISVLFGWCHGIIKLHAMLTVTEVGTSSSSLGTTLTSSQTTWGSRAGADSSDSERMVKQHSKCPGQQLYYDEKAYLEKMPLTHGFTIKPATAA